METKEQLTVVDHQKSLVQDQPDTTVVTPKRGDIVRIHLIDNGAAVAKYAHVIGVSNLDTDRLGENDEPYLTVVYPNSTDQKLLGGPDWHHAFTRVGPVHHGSAPSAQAGRESVYWVDLLPEPGEPVDIDSIDLDHEHADKVAAALRQREMHSGAGLGPVADANIPAQGATASDAVAQGRMTAGTPENSASTVAERINPGRRVPIPATQAERNAQLHANALAAGRQRSMTPVPTAGAPAPSIGDRILEHRAALGEGNK